MVLVMRGDSLCKLHTRVALDGEAGVRDGEGAAENDSVGLALGQSLGDLVQHASGLDVVDCGAGKRMKARPDSRRPPAVAKTRAIDLLS